VEVNRAQAGQCVLEVGARIAPARVELGRRDVEQPQDLEELLGGE